MRKFVYAVAAVAALAFAVTAATPGQAAEKMQKASTKVHRIAFHIDKNDKKLMNLVLNNVENLMQAYQDKGETAEIEVVAYGPGLMMLRDDKSPVKGRLASIKKVAFPSKLTYSACGNTMAKMEKKEGHPVKLVSEARIVPGGVVRLTELQEQGWAYIRP
jgi:intracellular sulfur oxidation DsrE/DsrF family protein